LAAGISEAHINANCKSTSQRIFEGNRMYRQEQTQDSPSTSRVRAVVTRKSSLVGIVIALALLAAVGWLAWILTHPDTAGSKSRPGFGGRSGPPTTTVGVAAAERADIPVTVDALGTVAAAATVTVRAQVSGTLQQILFHEGQTVKAGQVLATIDPRQFEMSMMQATGQLRRDEAQLETARITLERYRTLLSQDSIARQDVDTQASLVKQLEGTVMTDRANEGTAKINLGYTRITAPVAGRIGLKAVDMGNIVTPTDANGIAVITQTSPIAVTFAIPQDLVPELQTLIAQGKALQVTAFDRTRTTTLDTGALSALDNLVDVQTGTVKAKATFPNVKSTLFPNQFVNVRMQLRTIQGAIVVPVTAVRHGGNGDFVYVLDAATRTVALRPVKSGQATVDKVEIVSGLQAGEQVITEGADRLKDGAHVMLAGDKPTTGGRDGTGKKRHGQGSEGQQREGSASASADAASGTPDAAKREAWKRRHAQEQGQGQGQSQASSASSSGSQ
jgi:multidrug efflux system membrane fusion protein